MEFDTLIQRETFMELVGLGLGLGWWGREQHRKPRIPFPVVKHDWLNNKEGFDNEVRGQQGGIRHLWEDAGGTSLDKGREEGRQGQGGVWVMLRT